MAIGQNATPQESPLHRRKWNKADWELSLRPGGMRGRDERAERMPGRSTFMRLRNRIGPVDGDEGLR